MTTALLPVPDTRYAKSGDVSIAYQVMGEGPIDLIMVPGLVSHVEFAHETEPAPTLPGVTRLTFAYGGLQCVHCGQTVVHYGWGTHNSSRGMQR
jgi:hypothetical protein